MNVQSPMYISGVTPEGKFLYGGVFQMHDRIGFPVDCCIDEAAQKGMALDFLEALCDCWLNDCLKFDSFTRQIESQLPNSRITEKWHQTMLYLLNKYPKCMKHKNPINVLCRYVLAKKRKGLLVCQFSLGTTTTTTTNMKYQQVIVVSSDSKKKIKWLEDCIIRLASDKFGAKLFLDIEEPCDIIYLSLQAKNSVYGVQAIE